MMAEDNQLETLVFDYLEGNLSAEAKRSFEVRLSSNEDLKLLVDAWGKTYVREELPVTEALEKSILRSSEFRWNFSLNIFLPIVVLFLFDGQPLSSVLTVERYPEIQLENQISEDCKITDVSQKIYSLILPESKRKRQDSNPKTHTQELVDEKPTYPSFQVTRNAFPIPIKINPQVSGLKISRIQTIRMKPERSEKDLRKIRRQVKRKKSKGEFFKGNKPYVIPLNQNF